MESGGHGGSETSGEESDRSNKEDTASTANKRSYECTFCKRGFTNAQALGGHMNIHRKDRAKAKHTAGTSSKVHEDYANPNYFTPPVSGDHHLNGNYYTGLEGNRRSYMYFQSSSESNPRQSHGYNYHRGHGPRSTSMNRNNEELWGANLSLQIGSNLRVEENQNKEDDLDLELRLGQDP